MQTTSSTQQRSVTSSLQHKAAMQLSSLLTSTNLCYYMNYPECYGTLELNATISYILQSETDKVLASPYFLELSLRGLLQLLEKKMLNVPEIEVWRAALKWAKHRAKSEDGAELRRELATPLKHIRFCTLQIEDFHREVAPTRVLTEAEVTMVCSSLTTKAELEEMSDICNKVVPRDLYPTSYSGEFLYDYALTDGVAVETTLSLHTENQVLELLSLSLMAAANPPENQETYECEGSLRITRITGTTPHLSSDVQIQFNFCENVECVNDMFDLTTHQNGRNIILFPHSSYEFRVTFTQPHDIYGYPSGFHSNGNFSVNFSFGFGDDDDRVDIGGKSIETHISAICYRAIEL